MRLTSNSLAPFALAVWCGTIPAIWVDLALVWAPVAALVTAAYFYAALPDRGHPYPGKAVAILIAKCWLISLPPLLAVAAGWLPGDVPGLSTGFDQWLTSLLGIIDQFRTEAGRLLVFSIVAASLTTILLIACCSRKLQRNFQFDSAIASADAAAAARVQINFDAASFGLIFLPIILFVLAPPPELGAGLALYAGAITVSPYLLLLLWAGAASNNRSDAEIATHKNNRKG